MRSSVLSQTVGYHSTMTKLAIHEAMERLKVERETEERLVARNERLANAARTRERKRDTRRKIIVGGVFLAECRKSENMAELVLSLLRRRTESDRDRALLALDLGPDNAWPWHPSQAESSNDAATSPRPKYRKTSPPASLTAVLHQGSPAGNGDPSGQSLEKAASLLAGLDFESLSPENAKTVDAALDQLLACIGQSRIAKQAPTDLSAPE